MVRWGREVVFVAVLILLKKSELRADFGHQAGDQQCLMLTESVLIAGSNSVHVHVFRPKDRFCQNSDDVLALTIEVWIYLFVVEQHVIQMLRYAM